MSDTYTDLRLPSVIPTMLNYVRQNDPLYSALGTAVLSLKVCLEDDTPEPIRSESLKFATKVLELYNQHCISQPFPKTQL